MNHVIISDLHFGVSRVAGTTPASRIALKKYLIDKASSFIETHCQGSNLIILGDLFDGFTVDESDVLEVFILLNNYLETSTGTLFLIGGNHDWNPRGDKTSSFHLLSGILKQRDGVVIVDKGLVCLDKNIYVIPHVANQDIFDIELESALSAIAKLVKFNDEKSFLLLHANCNSPFATHSDHSLNVNLEWIHKFRDAGITLIFAHEHQKKEFDGVVCLGNQFPSSISDCIGNRNKYAHVISGDELKSIKTWQREDSFVECDWQDLADLDGEHQFIRVVGHAESEQAEAVINALATARRTSTAFIISNAVQIGDMAEMDGLSEMNANEIKAFDVLAALLDELTEREQDVVRKLLEV